MDKWSLKIAGSYALALGALYVACGLLEILSRMGVSPFKIDRFIPADPFSGFASIVVGATYLYSVRALLTGREEGLPFLLGGVVLSTILGVTFILVAGAHWLDSWLEGGEFSLAEELRPEIWLFASSLPVAYFTLQWIRASGRPGSFPSRWLK
ncbi:MAG: hypothetical protein P3X22_003390 [Thermoprotei archaeon]|nr:hypothetical protein [Thermoprotei archaeon]